MLVCVFVRDENNVLGFLCFLSYPVIFIMWGTMNGYGCDVYFLFLLFGG